ncbi:MAG: CotH kinase family protein [Bacteroidetes bacterium]|nr:CotH kinase family protein [Bacteroidota bacterium]MBL7103977.1 CotH kinase family protein [Bacteroidales bacterium]
MRRKVTSGILLLLTFITNILCSQPSFPDKGQVFVDSIVPRIDIFINPDTLQWIYDNPESNTEFHANFIFDNGIIKDTVIDVGFRLRGNTSRWAAKKSFKVSFNKFEPGRKYYGLEKLNLNGEHNDPSVIRAKLCWDLLREFDIPAPRSNHVLVYINNNYYGLYINVEHIDEEFVDSRFGNQDGNLYKCLWPADLDYLGSNPDLYKFTAGERRAYALKTNVLQDDYSDLAHFIDVLNNTPDEQLVCELDKVFNIYDYLKIIAVDIFTGNWDGYIYNKNNFYLYHNTQTGKFEYIPYDPDNTYGIDWFGRDWGTRNIYDWQQHGGEVRPLYTRLISNSKLKDQFSFYLNKLITEYTDENLFFPRMDEIKEKITPYVEVDPYYTLDYGYTISDFHNSYIQALGGHVTYGLKPYIQIRNSTAIEQLILNSINPVIKYIGNRKLFIGQNLWVRAYVEDEDTNPEVKLVYTINYGSSQFKFMYDDGEHFDGEEGDKIYGGVILDIPVNTTIKYRISAEDNFGYYSIMPCSPVIVELLESEEPALYINEFMASNDSTIADEYGEYDDWIEIYNGDEEQVWLGDKYLSDNLQNPDKWQMPDINLEPGDFILIWADNDPEQGANHTDFKLDIDGEEIGIFDAENTGFFFIDTITFGQQITDVSFGREPDGGYEWIFYIIPTPGYSNVTGSIVEIFNSDNLIKVYPNPVNNGIVYFDKSLNFQLFNSVGQLIARGTKVRSIDVHCLNKGIYFIVTDEGVNIKLMIQ